MDCIEQTKNKVRIPRRRIMQSLALILFTMAPGPAREAYGQTFSEWFRQQKTQKEYLLQQISALMIYRQYAQKGYSIARGGLGAISWPLSGELALHQDHYRRLRTVSGSVKSEPQVRAILSREEEVLRLTRQIKSRSGLTEQESRYVGSVCKALLADCDGLLNDLQTVLEDQKVTMADEERLRQIARIHRAMQDNYRFANDFSDRLKIYALQRKQEQTDVNTLKHWYGKAD